MTDKSHPILTCPNCYSNKGYEKDDNEEVSCKNCGLVISSPYPYSAGIRFKTLTQIFEEKENENRENYRWRKYYAKLKII